MKIAVIFTLLFLSILVFSKESFAQNFNELLDNEPSIEEYLSNEKNLNNREEMISYLEDILFWAKKSKPDFEIKKRFHVTIAENFAKAAQYRAEAAQYGEKAARIEDKVRRDFRDYQHSIQEQNQENVLCVDGSIKNVNSDVYKTKNYAAIISLCPNGEIEVAPAWTDGHVKTWFKDKEPEKGGKSVICTDNSVKEVSQEIYENFDYKAVIDLCPNGEIKEAPVWTWGNVKTKRN
jgi:hypothetical protein